MNHVPTISETNRGGVVAVCGCGQWVGSVHLVPTFKRQGKKMRDRNTADQAALAEHRTKHVAVI